MPSLRELADNLPNFNYYSGTGNFTQNNIKYPDPSVLFGPEATLMLKRRDFRWSPSNFDDGLVPFGVVTRLRRAVDDTLRIGKYLTRTPSGLIFTIKQTALQASNPSIEYDPTTSPLSQFGPTRIYSPLPLLAQVAGNAIGARFMRHGIFPKISNTTEYESYILKKDSQDNNRLKKLAIDLSNPDSENSTQNYVRKYKGGPESKYGIGNTTINRYGKILLGSTINNDNGFIKIPMPFLLSMGRNKSIKVVDRLIEGADYTENIEYVSTSLNNQNTEAQTLGSNYDFRSYKNKGRFSKNTNIRLPESDYQKLNLETRIGVARTRRADQKQNGVANEKQNVDTHDKVNYLSLFYDTSIPDAIGKTYDYNGNIISYNPNGIVSARDIIKFRIKSIDNDNPTKGIFMVFRAYISNIKRSVVSKWNPYNYVGRGESFYLYDGFTETITFSFTIVASSRLEMKPLYQKLNYLISTLTPDYSKDLKMRGNISELTIGDFLLYQPGIITNLDLTIDEDSNWEIAIDEPDQGGIEKDMHELPQLIKCSMTFIPIYNFLAKKNAKAPFIGINSFALSGSEQRSLQDWTIPDPLYGKRIN